MLKNKIVTIDGPSGVGKSTISRRVAAELGYTYLDTGAMYRAVACACQQAGVEIEESVALSKLLDSLDIELLPAAHAGDDVGVLLGGKDVSKTIRSPEMAMLASTVSALPSVRKKLTVMQQEMGKKGQLVAEGRDTGTVVFPQAAWKFYLDATPEERTRRRVKQLRIKGQSVDKEEILAQIIQRDRDDRERTIAPLCKAEDALLVDTSILTIDEVVDQMLASVRKEEP